MADREADIRAVYAAINSRDAGAVRRLTPADTLVDTRGFFPDGDVYEGHDQLERLFADIYGRWSEVSWAIEAIEFDGERGYVDLVISGKTAAKEFELTMPIRHVWEWPEEGPARVTVQRR